jgi:phage terminase large subunit-like protein
VSDLADALRLIADLDHVQSINKLTRYKPYAWQLEFHNAEGYQTPAKPAQQRLAKCGNKVGKTYAHAMEVAFHATGMYPAWWKGTRFLFPPEILVCGPTNELVRDIWQRELFGDPTDDKALGTGSIPKLKIGKRRPKTGVPNAFDSVRVQHVSGGWSRVYLRAYEQGWKKFQGIAFEYCGSDEEPPPEIWSQLIRAGLARRGAIIVCTMTPEEGMTEVVAQFMENLQKGQALIEATWDDAPHLTADVKEQRLMALRPHEREMRSKGVPLAGAGLIFCVSDDDLLVDPMPIPDHWRQLIGVDFGISTQHPFSAAKLAIDPDTDTTYLVAEYQTTEERAAVHVADLKKWPGADWIPVSWPHDGANREKGTGDELQQTYRKEGLTTLLPWKATNPPDAAVGQKEGEGGNSVEKAVLAMLDDMLAGKFKVFRSCQRWMKEKRLYHRDLKGKIVRLHEDLICASRYAHMMRRHADSAWRRRAVVARATRDRRAAAVGMRNW